MFFPVNMLTTPMIEENLNDWGFPDYGLQLPNYTEEEWATFDGPFCTLPPVTAYAVEAYTSSGLYASDPVSIAPSQIYSTPSTVDTPPAQAGSPGGSSNGTGDDSEDGSPRGEPSSRYAAASSGHSTTGGRRRTKGHTPYNIRERPSISPAKYTASTSTDSDSDEAFSPAPVFSCNEYRSPFDAAYLDSRHEKIEDELGLLSRKLGQYGLKRFKHHPYMTCPVFDCEKGGFNELLHGSTSALPTTTSTRRSAPSSISRSLNTRTKLSTYQPTGPFSSFNEVSRHVKSKHMPAPDLRCSYPGCVTQDKLDNKPYGKGRFSRADVLKTHLENEEDHRSHIPEEVRLKYKLW